MSGGDAGFAGSIPALYHHHLGPLLFEPYAEEVARRSAALRPGRILETAAGTGIVTAALAQALPDSDLVATDLNQAMLDIAAQRIRSDRVRFEVADAQALPFGDAEFDLVVCQFGVMFYPDKVRANREAHRVLARGGRYLLVVWDRLEENPASRIIHEAVAAQFPDDPPGFLARTPFGYWDTEAIAADLRAGGFTAISTETLALRSRPAATARDAAIGMVYGSPLRSEIEERDPGALERAAAAAAEALERLSGPRGKFDSRLSAHLLIATR